MKELNHGMNVQKQLVHKLRLVSASLLLSRASLGVKDLECSRAWGSLAVTASSGLASWAA